VAPSKSHGYLLALSQIPRREPTSRPETGSWGRPSMGLGASKRNAVRREFRTAPGGGGQAGWTYFADAPFRAELSPSFSISCTCFPREAATLLRFSSVTPSFTSASTRSR
jgi:hypothetical protein